MTKLKLLITALVIALFGLALPGVAAEVTLEPLVIDGNYVTHYGTTDNVLIPTTYEEKLYEFRGVWVATVYNLNMPQHTSETQYKAAFEALLDEVEESKMNAIVFQVRPQNDAFYDSAYAPWSRWLTGTEGGDPGWDVMAYMIAAAHSRGIEFHAWLNPYRVANTTLSKSSYLATLDDENFAKQNPALVTNGNVDSNGRLPLILNPGEPAVKTYIRDVITELITLYDVDGVHFDDYFYPYSGISADYTTYTTYKVGDESIEDWRRENVNDVVRGVKEDIDAHNTANGTDVRFGISPFGIWKNGGSPDGAQIPTGTMESYFDQYADTKRWIDEGWLHYINPQVYWNFENYAPYADVVDWWVETVRGTGVDLIIGHAPSSAYSQSWDTEEIGLQLKYNQQYPEITGEMMYSAAFLDYSHMQHVEANYWTTKPVQTWAESDVPTPSIGVTGTLDGDHYTTDVTVTITGDADLFYRINFGAWTPYTAPFVIAPEGDYVVHAKSVDAVLGDSLIAGAGFTIDKTNTDIPTITITGDMIGDNYEFGSTLSITSDGTPIWVKINHGSPGVWTEYTEPITLDSGGGYLIIAKTITVDGVESATTEQVVYVQELCYDDPTHSISGTGTDPYFQNATLTLSGDSPTILYKINDGAYQTYTAPIDFDMEGDYTVTYKNDDECGVEQTVQFTIDQTAPADPTLTITGDYDGERYHTSVTSLALSHVEPDVILWYRLHNGSTWTEWTIYSEPIVLQFNATYTFEYVAVDLAENAGTILDERIRLQIPPSEDNLYVIRDGEQVTYYGTSIPIELPTEYTEKNAEIRAVWVATVANIDIGQHSNEADYKATIINMLDTIQANNFNLIFFQVRPMNDAFYDSMYAPWSRYLTGTEGVDPGWDVFAFLIQEAHVRGIEVHAWLNPYRVSTGTADKAAQLAVLDDENFAKQNPDLVIADSSGKLILNPGEPQVQAYIKNVIAELIALYDVDGVHFDDYFYSYNGMSDVQDAATYDTYKDVGQSLDDWRRENINTVVREVYELIQQYNTQNGTKIKFGISPFGIWKSGGLDGSNTSPYTLQSYSDQYADTKRWVEEGWLDYIMPQLYWEFDHSAAPFADLVDWWADVVDGTGVDLIIGQGFYRYDDDSWDDPNELLEQLRYMTKYDVIIGSSFFSYKVLNSFDTEVVQAVERLNGYYWTQYVTFPWDSDIEPLVCEDGYHIEDGACVPDVIECEDGYHLEGDQCVPDVIECEDGYHLEGDQCVPDVIECEDGYHLEGDQCVPDVIECEDGYHLEGDECVPDTVTCEDGYQLIDGECVEIFEEETGCFSSIALFRSLPLIGLMIAAASTMVLLRRRQ